VTEIEASAPVTGAPRRPLYFLFLLTALMPQRWFYDTLILWLIPKTRKEILWTAFFSWGAGIWRWYHIPHSFTQVGRWMIIFLYLPMLVVLLARPQQKSPQNPQTVVIQP